MTNEERDLDITEVYERIGDVLMVLSDVAVGDYSTRLEENLPESHPVGALYLGINEMIQSLSQAKVLSDSYQRELEEKLATIEQQKLAIKELSTPIIEIWDGVVCVPVVGLVDSIRSSDMTDALLRTVVEKRAKYAIIDVTGIEVMDTRTADHFLRMAKAVRLLGSSCVLTGINPAIAQTMVHIGVDLSTLETHRSLRDALLHYVSAQRKKP